MNNAIHGWLGDHGFILLIVAQLAEADQINGNILAKLHAEIKCDFGCQNDSIRIIPVDMQNWRINHFDDIRAIQGRAAVARIRCGKANLVVDDDVNGSAGSIAACL